MPVKEIDTEIKTKQENTTPDQKGGGPKFDTKQLLMIAMGIICILGGVGVFMLWMDNQRNPFFAVFAIGAITGGVYLIYTHIKARGDSAVVIGGKIATRTEGPVNSMNIYGRMDPTGRVHADHIAFEFVENPIGQIRQCLNTGKYYYVHIYDIDTEQLIPFELPDAKFVDPAVMARYLEIPAQRKYLKYRDSLMKYIGYGILALIDGAALITIIAMSG